MTTKVINSLEYTITHVRDMANNDIGNILNFDHKGKLVLKKFDLLISLNDDDYTWSDGAADHFEVQLLPKGSQVILTVE